MHERAAASSMAMPSTSLPPAPCPRASLTMFALLPFPKPAESDARFASFDFHAAHQAAPPDLQQLLDSTESLPFRRRGYERDGMLKTLVERAGERVVRFIFLVQ